ncbi:hypothetical protein [Leekyejoonella antrihumi]|uniref:Uncharacterized protein n=1 Tax=Leekyejoonella antrihumi TaxID=1660198 RepID=A0A563E486_9MICO|nr:hypothetical protein [Leekyejoonella antrihumi]TWP37119.1 hypothetical protein FGL98_06780 [Leekyejoonella antrihumi]
MTTTMPAPIAAPLPTVPGTAYTLPGVSWLSLQVQGTAGTLTVGSTSLAVQVTPPADGSPAQVRADLHQVTLGALIAAAGAADPLATLPPALVQAISPAAIASIGVSVDLAGHRLAGCDLTVDAVPSWAPGGVELDKFAVNVALTRTADGTGIDITGTATFAGAGVTLAISRDPAAMGAAAWSLHAGLAAGATLSASAVATAYGLSVPSSLPDLALSGCALDAALDGSAVSFTATSPTQWRVPVGPDGISVGQLAVAFDRTKAGSTGSVSGTVQLAGVNVPVTYAVPGGLTLHATIDTAAPFALIEDVVGAASVGALTLPPELVALTLTDVVLAIDVDKAELSFAATGPGFKRVQAVVRKGTSWGFALGIELDDDYRFSSLSPALTGLDTVHLPDALIVISSFDDTTFTFDELQPEAGTGVSEGVVLDGRLDLSGLGADKFLGEAHLDVKAQIGPSLADLELDAGVGDITITDGVVLKDAKFALHPDPENVSISVSGAVAVTIDSSRLEFIGGVSVVPNGISFFATMKGTWRDPFGAKGIALTDVSLQIGSDFEGVPSIGIAAGLTVGAFQGNAAVSFNSQNPAQSVLIVAFNHLSLMDVVETFCPTEVTADIPSDVQGTLAGVSLENVDLYVVPQDTSIGALNYKQGLRVGGTLHVAGFTATADVEVDQQNGIKAKGSLSPVVVGDVFSLTGTDPKDGPDLDIEVTATAVPKIAFDGQVNLLGVTAGASVSLSDSGFDFRCGGRVFELFSANVHSYGGNLQSGAGFMVHADLQQDFLSDLARRAAAVLQRAGADAQARIAAAQQGVSAAQVDVQRFSASVQSAQADLASAQADAQTQLQELSARVTQAQQALGAIDAQIGTTQAQIQAQRDAAAAQLTDLQQKLAAAQNSVNTLSGQVNGQQAQIDQLNGEIAWWNNWYNNLAWYDRAWGWTELGAEVGWRGTQVAGLELSIQALRGSLAAANGVLQLAQQAVNAALAAQASYPIDQDPRILALQGGQATAQLALQTAQSALAAAQQVTAAAISVASQALTGFQQQLGTATMVLQAANAALTQLNVAIGDVAAVSAYIAAHGLDSLLDVRTASFTGTLDATSGGSVTLDADVVFQGTEEQIHLTYDFHDLAAGAEALAKEVLPALPL